MRVIFKLAYSDRVRDRVWKFHDWSLPLPSRKDSVRLWAAYDLVPEEARLNLQRNSQQKVLCVFYVDRLTFDPRAECVEIDLTFVAPVLE
jgi:hypothetical protein